MTDVMRKTSGWIQSASNTMVSFIDPDPMAFDINDIALALSRQPRYGGHGKFFYSVAQHSVYVAYQVKPKNRLYALLHDAHEAYTGDIPAPLKELLGQRIIKIEQRLQKAIHESLGLDESLDVNVEKDIMRADKSLLYPEYHALYDKHIWHVNGVKPAQVEIERMSMEDAKELFLACYFIFRSRNVEVPAPRRLRNANNK